MEMNMTFKKAEMKVLMGASCIMSDVSIEDDSVIEMITDMEKMFEDGEMDTCVDCVEFKIEQTEEDGSIRVAMDIGDMMNKFVKAWDRAQKILSK